MFGIDGEELKQLKSYVDFLISYNNRINLIGKSTVDDIWSRHIADSLQLLKLIDDKNIKLADLGSGAGLPGIPLSIAGIGETHLFEKSPRKSEFLTEVKKFSNNKIIVRNENLLETKDNSFDIIVSRALGSLNLLLQFSQNLKKDNTKLIFLKGKKIYQEIAEAEKNWEIKYELFDSETSGEGKIIQISSFSKK